MIGVVFWSNSGGLSKNTIEHGKLRAVSHLTCIVEKIINETNDNNINANNDYVCITMMRLQA